MPIKSPYFEVKMLKCSSKYYVPTIVIGKGYKNLERTMHMSKKFSKYIFPIILITFLLIEWINVFFVGGVIKVVSWWSIFWSSFIGLIIFILVIGIIILKLIKHKNIHLSLLATMLISLIMGYPFCWFLGIGQIAYPAEITSVQPAVSIRLPINETTVVGWGGNSLENNRPHAIAPMERWAYDLLVEPYSMKSDDLKEYGIYDMEVIAPATGTVVAVYDKEDDILPGSEDNKTMTGNYIYLQLEETGTYLVLAHLKKGSILVQKGQYIKEGTPIARVGNSGSTSEPHLHIHHQRQNPASTNIFFAEGLPLYFRDINGPPMPNGGSKGDIISPK